MKKILFVILAIFAIASCKPKVDFNKLMQDDYAAVVAEFGDSVKFYEVETVLTKPINLLDDNIAVSASSTIIQAGNKIKQIDRIFKNSRIKEENVTYNDGWWAGDFMVELDSVNLNLKDAIQKLHETNTVLPETTYMTFRKPAAPPFRTQYIFGSEKTFFISVDAGTGEVNVVE